jgi:hypothetical protein
MPKRSIELRQINSERQIPYKNNWVIKSRRLLKSGLLQVIHKNKNGIYFIDHQSNDSTIDKTKRRIRIKESCYGTLKSKSIISFRKKIEDLYNMTEDMIDLFDIILFRLEYTDLNSFCYISEKNIMYKFYKNEVYYLKCIKREILSNIEMSLNTIIKETNIFNNDIEYIIIKELDKGNDYIHKTKYGEIKIPKNNTSIVKRYFAKIDELL